MLDVLRAIREERRHRSPACGSPRRTAAVDRRCRGIEPKKLSGLMRGGLDWIVMKAVEKDSAIAATRQPRARTGHGGGCRSRDLCTVR